MVTSLSMVTSLMSSIVTLRHLAARSLQRLCKHGSTHVLASAGHLCVSSHMCVCVTCPQINGNYKVNAPHLRPYHAEACALMATLYQGVVARPVEHIPREENGVADELSNQAMDMAAKHLRWRGT